MSVGRRASVLGLALSAALVAGSVSVPLAAADTLSCVTKAEYKKVRVGWSLGRVHRTFDTKGRRLWFIHGSDIGGYPPEQGRKYKTCKDGAHVTIVFEKPDSAWEVTEKIAVW